MGEGESQSSELAPGVYSVSLSELPSGYKLSSGIEGQQTVRIDDNGVSDGSAYFRLEQITGIIPFSLKGLARGQQVLVTVRDANGVKVWEGWRSNGEIDLRGATVGKYSVGGWRSKTGRNF